MNESYIIFLLEAANYFEQRPTKGEDRAYWSNVNNAEKCRNIAKELESNSKDYALLQEKYDELLVEYDHMKNLLKINTEQQAAHIKGLIDSWETERKTLTEEINSLKEGNRDLMLHWKVLRADYDKLIVNNEEVNNE